MKMPIGLHSYGLRFFGFRIIRNKELSFRRLVAQQCYNLTHELVVTKVTGSFTDSRFSGYTNNAWMTLDAEMKEFTRNV
jgi:hypothetical protein